MLCLYIIVNEEKYIDYFPPYLYYSGNRQLLLLLVWKPKAHSPVNARIDRTRLNIVNGILSSIGDFFFVVILVLPIANKINVKRLARGYGAHRS